MIVVDLLYSWHQHTPCTWPPDSEPLLTTGKLRLYIIKSGKIIKNVGKYVGMWENMLECGKICRNVGKLSSLWENIYKCELFD